MKTSNINQGRAHHEAIVRGWVSPYRAGGSGVTVGDGSTTSTGITGIEIIGGTVVVNGDGTVTITVGGSQWFNVKNYGAVGDGTTDDRDAINLAIAALNTAGAGVLYFPASPTAYYVSDALTAITCPAMILGDGRVSADGPGSKISTDHATANLFTLNDDGCEIQGIACENTNAGPTAGAAFNIPGGSRFHVDAVSVVGFWQGFDIENSGSWTMHDVLISNCWKYGVRIRNTASPDAGDWSIVSLITATTHGADAAIRIESSGGGKISGLKVNTAYVRGIDMSFGAGAISSIFLLANSSIENVTSDAIRTATTSTGAFQQILIHGCQFYLPNNAGRVLNANGPSMSRIIVSNVFANTNGTARAAISLTDVTTARIGPNIQLIGNFNAPYTTAGTTSGVVDDTGAIGNQVAITGTPTSGQVPVASSGTAAAWGTLSTAPTGAAGGDLSGTYPNPSVVDDSHSHTAATLPASSSGEILISDTPSTPLVFADLIQNEAQDDLVYADT